MDQPWCERIAVQTKAGVLTGVIGLVGASAFELWTTNGQRTLLPGGELPAARCIVHDAPYARCSSERLRRA